MPHELETLPLYGRQTAALRARSAARSADYQVEAKEWIVYEGSAPYFWTLLEGEVEVVKRYGNQVSRFTTFGPGDYFGELPLLLGAAVYVGVRAIGAARLMRTTPPTST